MIISSFVIIEREDHFLLVSESSERWKDKWYFPGGKLRSAEDPVSAAIRETKEETECDVILDGIFYFKLERKFIDHKLDLFYHGRVDKNRVKTKEDDNSKGTLWVPYHDLRKFSLREDAINIIEIYRNRSCSLPIYSFNFVRKTVSNRKFQKDKRIH